MPGSGVAMSCSAQLRPASQASTQRSFAAGSIGPPRQGASWTEVKRYSVAATTAYGLRKATHATFDTSRSVVGAAEGGHPGYPLTGGDAPPSRERVGHGVPGGL
jgi:hypothetical protein